MSRTENKKQKRYKLFIFWLFLTTTGLILPINFLSSPSASVSQSFREPFKDFFDYEWWLQGSEYAGKGSQYGKWFVLEVFWDDGIPRQLMHISSQNPISGTDSAVIEIDGSKSDVSALAWAGVRGPYEPDGLPYPVYLNPAHLRFRFRIDEWITTNPTWRVTLAGFGGIDGGSSFESKAVIGLEGLDPPKLRLHYRIGDSFDWWTDQYTQKILSQQTVSVGDVHTLELMSFSDSVNGAVGVWLDGVSVPDLSVSGLDTSFPGGVKCPYLGNSYAVENGFFATGHSAGSRCKISFDDYKVRDEYIGVDPLPTTYDLTLDSSPQGKTVRVGNHILGITPVTIQVPEGTVPKVGIDPTGFDHWEITPSVTGFPFSEYEELWPDMSPSLMSTVTIGPPPSPGGVGDFPTPAIYTDSRITAIYTTSVKHSLTVTSNPVATSFTVDELDYTTLWSDSLTEGTHTIAMPLTFTVGEKRYDFRSWEDDSTNPTRTMDLTSDMHVTAYYDETIIPEFPTLTAWLVVVVIATLVIVLGARKLKVYSRTDGPFHLE